MVGDHTTPEDTQMQEQTESDHLINVLAEAHSLLKFAKKLVESMPEVVETIITNKGGGANEILSSRLILKDYKSLFTSTCT